MPPAYRCRDEQACEAGRRCDCRWPERQPDRRVTPTASTTRRHSWEQDHRREREAYGRGDAFRRYTWGDVFEQPEPMLAELRTLL